MTKQSIWAVVAGVLVIVGVTTIVDAALHLVGVYPPLGQAMNHGQSIIATVYRIVIGIAGAWLTARLAPGKPMKHAMILAAIGTAAGLVGLVATWNADLGPRWYPVAHVVLAIPECWLGAVLYSLSNRAQAQVQ